MKLLRSLTFRLALYYAALFALSVSLLGALFYVVTIWAPLEQLRSGIAVEAEHFATLHEKGTEVLSMELERRAAEPAPRLAYHALLDPAGQTVTTNLPSWPRTAGSEWIRIEADVAFDGDEDEHEALVNDRVFSDGCRLLVGRDIDDLDELQETFTDTLIWLLPAIILLSLGGAALMSRAIGHRLESVATAAQRVIAGDLGERIPMRGTGDDFERLGETLNLMLERIEQGMDGVRRVTDSVAHELRTPLTRLRASLAALEQNSDKDAVAEAIQEAERLETIFNAVLRIARIESTRIAGGDPSVDLSAILLDATELYQAEAETRGQRLEVDVEPDLWVAGDRDLLFQAVANLLDNAVKFSPDGGRIAVRGEAEGSGVRIIVEDEGPGVPPEFHDRITERFFRAPEAVAVQGAGLGLSLVAAVAAFHKAPLAFASTDPGFRIEWRFDRSSARLTT